MTTIETSARAPKRVLAGLLSLLLVGGALGLLVPGSASADSAPPVPSPATPPTVTADGLPTVQINGVAWSQVTVGNTVYVAGNFTRARPAGAAPGTNETVRNHILAYDIRTGNLITSFAPSLNSQALAITASPDGQRIYVAGNFTQVNGQTRNRVAALTPAGALVDSFRPSVGSQVRAVAATNDTVYLGGNFGSVGGVSRNRLAAVRATDGALLPWAPVAGVGDTSGNRNGNFGTSTEVLALVVTGGGSQVVAAGRFDSLNGVKATGVGAVDGVTGTTTLPFAVNQLITNQGVNSAVNSLSLSADGTTVFGTAYDYYGPGNLEGSFAASAVGGAVQAINACHGDTYSSFAQGGALYLATHAHQCAPIGGYPEQDPRVNKFATAVTTVATRTVQGPGLRGISFVGQPGPSMLNWFPTMTPGSFTGQGQAGWSVTGNNDYVAFGGEFPRVNGVNQQGLVRYALSSNAPNRIGPTASDNLTPAVASLSSGTARVSWRATFDYDNEYLSYRVVRNGNTANPVYVTPAPGVASTWWNTPQMGFVDRGLTPGATYTYRIYAVDPFGNQATRAVTSVVVSSDTAGGGLYSETVAADGASSFWRLDEPAGSPNGYDQIGFDDLTVGTGVTRGTPGGLSGSSNTASSFDGTPAGLAATRTAVPGPNTFSLEGWFKTASTAGGKILGFGSANTGISSNRDRHVYMDQAGRVYFGVYTGVRQAINGNGVYNDNQWHHVVATLGSDGMKLYVDGVQTAARTSVTAGQAYNGFWRIGGDRGWVGADYWTGAVDEVAVYPTVLNAGQVANHYSVGSAGTTVNVPPTAAFTATPTDLTAAFDASTSVDLDGTIESYAWDFGDGETGTGVTTSHVYDTANTYTVRLTVTDDDGDTGTTTRTVTVTDPPPNRAPEASFTATPSDLTVSVDAAGSSDSDGTIESYAWDFGDGATGTGVTTTHTYTSANTYTVTLTVTDDDGGVDTTTRSVTVTAPPVNQAPEAAFPEPTVEGLTVSVDGSGSTDGDGTVESHVWTFGDGQTANTATASHTYGASGTYTITLTVTDDDGATDSATRSVTVTAPAGPVVLASDDFDTPVSGGLGTADVGGNWTVTAGGSRQSVPASGGATFNLAVGTNTGSHLLGAVSSSSTEVSTNVTVASTPTGGGASVYVIGRRVNANGHEYRARLRFLANNTVRLALVRMVPGEQLIGTEILLPGTYTPGSLLNVKLRVTGTGTTALSATVWPSSATEPVVPSITRTDTTASLQAAGSVGLLAYLSASATSSLPVRFTSFVATVAD
jgi:PKD repeat protein